MKPTFDIDEAVRLYESGVPATDIAKTFNVTPSRVYYALHKAGVTFRASGGSSPRLVFNGERLTLLQWSERYGIKPTTLQARVYKMGWSLERALLTPVASHASGYHRHHSKRTRAKMSAKQRQRWATRKGTKRRYNHISTFTYKGVTLALREWAERYGIKLPTLQRRIYKMKWSLEKALETPVQVQFGGCHLGAQHTAQTRDAISEGMKRHWAHRKATQQVAAIPTQPTE